MDWLEKLLKEHIEADKLESVVDAFKKESPKHMIPKEVFNEKSDEVKTLKDQLNEVKKLNDDLSKKAGTVEEYEQKMAEWQSKYTELETTTQEKIANISKNTALKDLLITNGADMGLVDLLVEKYRDSAELTDEGKIKDADTLVSNVKKERASAFVTKQENSDPENNQTGGKPGQDEQKLRKAFGLK